jgi:hypothetical protein
MVAVTKAQAKVALDHVLENLFELDKDAAMIKAFTDMICIVRRVPRIGLVCLLGLKPWDWNNSNLTPSASIHLVRQ